MQNVVTIGDCIIDEFRAKGQQPRRIAGGAGLNLASALAKLGLPSTLLTRVGQDRDGYCLRRYALERGVKLINTQTVDPTGVAISTRVGGEPTYEFSPSMFRRRIAFSVAAKQAIAEAAAVISNSFPLDDPRQIADLVQAFSSAPGLRVVDPNPRPRLMNSVTMYRQGFERVLPTVALAKLSDEDVLLLYEANWEDVIAHLLSLGVGTVLFTHGPQGATLVGRDGLRVRVPIAIHPEPIVDTMGAGDATLASLVDSWLRNGKPRSDAGWTLYLERAMAVAAATCRNTGADLALA